MSIHAALSLLLEEYAEARDQAFAKNAMADMLRDDIPKEIEAAVADSARYVVEGSPGKGNWADVPWVAILDRFVTETAQQGYYLVYLAMGDCSGAYLSLNRASQPCGSNTVLLLGKLWPRAPVTSLHDWAHLPRALRVVRSISGSRRVSAPTISAAPYALSSIRGRRCQLKSS